MEYFYTHWALQVVPDSEQYPIYVQDLFKTYDGKKMAVDGISFSVNKGEIYGLLGKNGAGKSTTIKILTTLIPPSSGSARILGFDPVKHPLNVKKRIGVVQQEESFDFTTVETNMKIYATLWEVPREEAKARTEELLELFELDEVRKKRAFELSGGQKKRLQVARELIHDMDVLFLDEPTVGMDPIMRRGILDNIRKRAENGLTVLFTTHFLEEADYICDRIAIMSSGKIRVEGTSTELKEKYGGLRTLEISSGNTIQPETVEELKKSLVETALAKEVYLDGKTLKILGKGITRVLEDILRLTKEKLVSIDNINLRDATLDDVFIEVVNSQ